ncbi:hypothetical protein A2U01_0069179, partial [Trifolium medium]|nr:hypothetical protein [Trifolium medium]
MDNRAWKAVIK